MARKRTSTTLRTSYGTGSRYGGRNARRVASKGGLPWYFDPFAIFKGAMPAGRRGRRRTVRRRG